MELLNISLNKGILNADTLLICLKSFPIIFIIAMLIEKFIVGKFSEKLVSKFSCDTDGFNSKILFNIVFCVLGMSMIMTIIGTIMGCGFSLEVLKKLPLIWCRNFCVAFWTEILLAQPLARKIMKNIHTTKKSISIVNVDEN